MFQRTASMMFIALILAVINTGCCFAPPVTSSGYHGIYNRDPVAQRYRYYNERQYLQDVMTTECEEYRDSSKYPGIDVEGAIYACQSGLVARRIDQIKEEVRMDRKERRAIYQKARRKTTRY